MNCNYFLRPWFTQWAFPRIAAPSMTSLLSGGPAWSDTSLITLKGAQGRIRFLQDLSCGQSCLEHNVHMTLMIKTLELKWRRDISSLSFPFFFFFNCWLLEAVNHFQTEGLVVISLALRTPQLSAHTAELFSLRSESGCLAACALPFDPMCCPVFLPPSFLGFTPLTLLDSIPHAPSAPALCR